MHDVHTRIRLAAPFTIARTSCRFTFQRRLVTLWAWLIRFPNWGPRPQTSHTFAIGDTPRVALLVSVYHSMELGPVRWIIGTLTSTPWPSAISRIRFQKKTARNLRRILWIARSAWTGCFWQACFTHATAIQIR